MFIFTAKFSKKKAAAAILILGIILCCAVIAVGRIKRGGSEQVSPYSLSDNASRAAYLQSLGWEIDTSPVETLELILPSPLDSSYAEYNDLQKAQGFNLEDFCGKPIKRYTYTVLNYPGNSDNVQADIYICDNAVVAGDILSPGEDGFIAELAFPK